MTTIVLADDHEIVREGFRALLDAEPDLSVIGEAGNGQDAVRLVESLAPDILIVDLKLPGLNGLEVTWQVCTRSPETRVIVLSMHDSEPYVLEALRNGALAYVLKTSGAAELKKAVHEVMQGRRYLGPPLTERAIEAYVREEKATLRDSYASLTRREREIFQLTAEGLTSREIGERLSISPRTVDKHRNNLMGKLDLHSQTELIQYALARNLMVVPPSPFQDQ